MTRSRKWLVGVGGIVLVVAVVLYFFDWNLLRPFIARQVTASTGRSFSINGDLKVHLSLTPRIVANDVVLGNAQWSRDPTMADIKRLDLTVKLLPLLRKRLVLPSVSVSEPHIILEVNKEGIGNWVFNPAKNTQSNFPVIGALTIDRGTLIYRDPTIKTDLTLRVSTPGAANGDPESMVEIAGTGQYKGMPTTIQARGGALLSLRKADRAYPIKAQAMLGTTQVSIDGTLLDPLNLRGEQMNFRIAGSDMALLYPIVGVPLPPTPSYTLSGALTHQNELWEFHGFKGSVGKSDLEGDFTVDRSKQPQMITAQLTSTHLDMKDLGGFIGAGASAASSQNGGPSDKVLPNDPFSLEKLRAANADIHFQAAKILTQKMPLEKMSTHMIVNNGTLKLSPLDFGAAGGELVSQIEMDGRNPVIVTHADITARGLHLAQLFPSVTLARTNVGTLGGHAKLDGHGNSIAKTLGTANGEAAVIMNGGSVSELMLRLSNLDIANSIAVLLGGDKQVPIRCMVSDFKAVDGDFKVQAMVLDTPKVNITGTGDVNFTEEKLNLKIEAQAKGFSLASLRGPIDLAGSFKKPAVRVEVRTVLSRGGAAALLGSLTSGIGALIPLLEFGKDKDANCVRLMDEVKAAAGVKNSDIEAKRPVKPGKQ